MRRSGSSDLSPQAENLQVSGDISLPEGISIMQTKRVIMEQIDGDESGQAYSNFDAFSKGFAEGFSLKSAFFAASVIIAMVLLLIIIL